MQREWLKDHEGNNFVKYAEIRPKDKDDFCFDGDQRPHSSSKQRKNLKNKRDKNAVEIRNKDDRIADLEGACL